MDTCLLSKEKTNPDCGTEKTGEQIFPRRICFVCTGNTCRSPMAEAVANAYAAEMKNKLPETERESARPVLEAFSAGIAAHPGDKIAENAKRALEEKGICPVAGHDFRNHTAHTLCAEEAERFDLLIGMEPGHTMVLMLHFPHLAKKIVCMPTPIPDPYGGDMTMYRACLEEICKGVKTLLFSADGEEHS